MKKETVKALIELTNQMREKETKLIGNKENTFNLNNFLSLVNTTTLVYLEVVM